MGAGAHNERTQTKCLQRLESARRGVDLDRNQETRTEAEAPAEETAAFHRIPPPTSGTDPLATAGRIPVWGGRRQRGSRAHAHGGAARRSHQPIIVFDVTGFVSAASGVEEISMHPRNPSQAPGGRQPPTERRKWLARARASFCTCIVHSASLPLSGNVKMPSHMPSHTTSYGLATG